MMPTTVTRPAITKMRKEWIETIERVLNGADGGRKAGFGRETAGAATIHRVGFSMSPRRSRGWAENVPPEPSSYVAPLAARPASHRYPGFAGAGWPFPEDAQARPRSARAAAPEDPQRRGGR